MPKWVAGHTSRALFGQPLRLAFVHELNGDIAAPSPVEAGGSDRRALRAMIWLVAPRATSIDHVFQWSSSGPLLP
jgi:hypothetical protein